MATLGVGGKRDTDAQVITGFRALRICQFVRRPVAPAQTRHLAPARAGVVHAVNDHVGDVLSDQLRPVCGKRRKCGARRAAAAQRRADNEAAGPRGQIGRGHPIEACRQKTPKALEVIEPLMHKSSQDRGRLDASQFIVERGYRKAPERAELSARRQEGPLPGAQLTPPDVYLPLVPGQVDACIAALASRIARKRHRSPRPAVAGPPRCYIS